MKILYVKYSLALLTGLLLAGSTALAEKEKKLCPTPDDFLEEIYNCGNNSVAVTYGQACADAQLATSKLRAAALASAISELSSASSQQGNMIDVQKRLFLATNELGSQIESLQKNTELVASYTAGMIDFTDGVDDNSSAECFSKNFHALQKIVSGMDQEILKSKRARSTAIGMLKTLAGRTGNLKNLAKVNPVASDRAPASVPRGAQPKGKALRSSDITGTEKLKERH